jgi:hypothetical protein
MTGFQQYVNQQPAPGVEGDFAGNNPKASLPPPVEGSLKVAAGQTLRVGYFGWAGINGLVYSSAAGAAAVGLAGVGFVARPPNEPSALITAFLGESVMTLQAGMPVTLLTAGDFWAAFAAGAAQNVAVYATAATGAPTTTAGGNTATTFKTASVAAANAVTDAATVIAADTGVMTVDAMASGTIVVGQRVTGTGVPANTYIQRQLTGTPGGAGTYQTNSLNRDAVAAFTATMIQGQLAKITSYN